MNIAIIYGGRSSSCPKLEKLSKALAKGLEEQSHMVKVLNAYVDTDQRLSYFDFIIVGSEPMGLLSAKVPEQIRNFLRVVPGAGGKHLRWIESQRDASEPDEDHGDRGDVPHG